MPHSPPTGTIAVARFRKTGTLTSTPMIRRTRWEWYVDALAAGQRWWSEERPTQPAGRPRGQPGRTRTRGLRRAAPDSRARPAERGSDYDELEKLGKLHADGNLTDEEFAAAKAKILGA